MNCRACSKEAIKFFSLGDMPLVNSFLTKEDFDKEKKFDLSVAFCPNCYLVQLTEIVPPSELFEDYIYLSGTSSSFIEHCRQISHYFIDRFKLGPESLVFEIASNDGSLLDFFKKAGVRVLGIDPAKNIAKIANDRGIPTIPKFFNEAESKELKRDKSVSANLIFGANVLAHVPNINDFVSGVREILALQGTAVFESPYLGGLLEKKFDIIYHEHVFYYSILALKNLFAQNGLEIYDVEMTPMQGGSFMIFVSHPGVFVPTRRLDDLVNKEIGSGFKELNTYKKIATDVKKLKNDLMSLLDKIKQDGKKIAGYSAPAKGNVLLNYFGIGRNYLDFIVDKSKAKQGLYTPGTHLLVYPPEKIYQEKPDYLVILCWNIANEIVGQLKDYHDAGGKFIIPIPEVIVM